MDVSDRRSSLHACKKPKEKFMRGHFCLLGGDGCRNGEVKGGGATARNIRHGTAFLHCGSYTVANVYDGWISSPLAIRMKTCLQVSPPLFSLSC